MKTLLAITILLNGQPIEFTDAKPFVESGRVMVPMRGVFEKMGAGVNYLSQKKEVEIKRGATFIVVSVPDEKGVSGASIENSQMPEIAGEDDIDRVVKPPDSLVPVAIKNRRIFIPLRFIAQHLGAKVHWNNSTRTVSIDTAQSPKPSPRPAIRAGEIEVKLASDKTEYRAGETVKFTITAINQDERPRVVNFNSGQSFDITVMPANQDEVIWRWDWSRDKMFTMALREQTLQPGQTLRFEATWDQKDNDGKPMPRGEYSAQAALTANGGIKAPAITIRLVD